MYSCESLNTYNSYKASKRNWAMGQNVCNGIKEKKKGFGAPKPYKVIVI